MPEDLNNEGKRDGMKLNKKKTKIMCNEAARRRLRTRMMIDAEQLEEMTEYKYVGRLVTSDNEISKQRIWHGNEHNQNKVNGDKQEKPSA